MAKIAELEQKRSGLESQLRDLEQRLSARHPEAIRTKAALAEVGLQLNRLQAQLRTASTPTRPIIDTNFNMDVGETVVVGTSRLRGGERALIALLTAVRRGK